MSIRSKIDGLKAVWRFDNRWPLIFNKLVFPGESLHIYRAAGIEFLNDHSAGDANGARDVIFSPMYLRLLGKMKLNDQLNILDLGANNGGFPLMLRANGYEIHKAVCVELNPSTSSRLRFNLERNFNGKAVTVNAAVCGRDQIIEISLGAGSTSDNIYGSEGKGSRGKLYQLPGRTFDNIYQEFFGREAVDICKIDIEGAEFEIFRSDSASSIARCRYVVIEIHDMPGTSPREILERMSSCGFGLIDGPSEESVYLFANLALV
jgi:FkbM family methyltransferase